MPNLIAAIYARRSKDQPGVSDEAKSVTRQLQHARDYAARKGWTVADEHIYVDDGIGGAEFAARPSFIRLMNALKPKPTFQVLIMSEESRLGRESIETAYSLKQFVQAGVRLFFYLEDRERTLETPTDKLLLHVATFADELEREKARQRTYDAMLRKARAGYVTGGRTFGYDNIEVLRTGADGQPLRSHVERRINDAEAAVVRSIFEQYSVGWGIVHIAKTLNQTSAPCPRAQQGRPNGWAPSSVRQVLLRPLYRGVIVWNQTKKRDVWGQKHRSRKARHEHLTIDAPELRIVSEDLWMAAQTRFADIARTASDAGRGRPRGAGAKYLLAGLLRCARCGSSLEVRTRDHRGRRAAFISCSGFARRGATVCANRLAIPMEHFEETIFDCVEKHLLAEDVVEAALDRAVSLLTTSGGQDRREHLERDLSRVLRELENLTAAVAAGGDLSVLLDALKRREEERDGLAHQLAELNRENVGSRYSKPALRTELRRRVTDWRRLLREQVVEGRRILQQLVVGRIDCEPTEDRAYRLRGTGTFAKLFEGIVPQNLASPAGFEPASPP